jgi:hypothetical protein
MDEYDLAEMLKARSSVPQAADIAPKKSSMSTYQSGTDIAPMAEHEYDIGAMQSARSEPPKPITKTEARKTRVEDSLQKSFEELPGVKPLQSFMVGGAANISKATSAIEQLLGHTIGYIAPETGGAIEKNAIENAKKAEEINKPLAERNPIANVAGEVTGAILNPENKLVPQFGGPANSLIGAASKEGLRGAAFNVLTNPVMDSEAPFLTEKAKQAGSGFVAGGATGALFQSVAGGIGKGLEKLRVEVGSDIGKSQSLDQKVTNVLIDAGIDPKTAPPSFFNSLKEQAKEAIETGNINQFKEYAARHMDAQSLKVPVPMLRGQLTRDPYQYTLERELGKIEGAGKPIGDLLTNQNKALLANLDEYGAKFGNDVNKSGSYLSTAVKSIDDVARKKVSDAYAAFKNSTGRNLDVPLQGLAQDYAKALHDYGDVIPQGVRNNLNSLGLLSGKQLKVTTIEDAENLIKVINKNYDPMNKPAANALDDIRSSINNAIKSAGANEVGQAGQLAIAARKAASERFDTINSIPALKDAIKGKEPDKFFEKHILNGNVNEIAQMKDYLAKNNPEALKQLQSDAMRFIKDKVKGNVSDENAKFSHAQLKDYVNGQNGARFKVFLDPEQWSGLNKLNRVAENALYDPVASAVNRSNSASQAINTVKSMVKGGAVNDLLGHLASYKFPGVQYVVGGLQEANQRARASELINQAIKPEVRVPKEIPINSLIKPGISGTTLLNSMIQQRNQNLENQQGQ